MNHKMITTENINQVMELWDYCFEKKDSPFFKWYFENYCLKNNMILGGFDASNTKLLNMIHLNPYKINLRHKEEVAPYLVGIATIPEARGKRLTRGLLETSFDILRSEDINFVILLPINAGIYKPYDFEFCYYKHVYKLPLNKFALSDNDSSFSISHKNILVKEDYQDIYSSFGKDHDGMAIRTDFQWEKLLAVQQLEGVQGAIVKKADKSIGYMFYLIENRVFNIIELITTDVEAKKALLKFATNHRVNVDEIYWEATADDKTYLDFADASLTGTLKPFMMARCINAREVLNTYKVPADCPDCSFNILISDDLIRLNNHLLKVEVKAGQLTISTTTDKEDVAMKISAFTQIYFGAFTAEELAHEGRIKFTDSNVIEALTKLFPKCNNYINEYF